MHSLIHNAETDSRKSLLLRGFREDEREYKYNSEGNLGVVTQQLVFVHHLD